MALALELECQALYDTLKQRGYIIHPLCILEGMPPSGFIHDWRIIG